VSATFVGKYEQPVIRFRNPDYYFMGAADIRIKTNAGNYLSWVKKCSEVLCLY